MLEDADGLAKAVEEFAERADVFVEDAADMLVEIAVELTVLVVEPNVFADADMSVVVVVVET